MLLEEDFFAGGLVEDGDDADAVDFAALGPGAALGGFPDSLFAGWILIVYSVAGLRCWLGRVMGCGLWEGELT